MKNLKFSIKILVIVFLLQGCKKLDLTPIPLCVWDSEGVVHFKNLQMNYPSGLSTYHKNQLPFTKKLYILPDILRIKGDTGTPSQAFVKVVIFSDGKHCTGKDQRIYTPFKDPGKVLINTVAVPQVSSTNTFFGDVGIKFRTDSFKDISAYGFFSEYYHVYFDVSGNDPLGGINGNIVGIKVTHRNLDGTNSVYLPRGGSFFSNGHKVYL